MKAIRQTLKAIYKNALKFDHAFIVDTLQAQRSSETLISDDLFFVFKPLNSIIEKQ